MKWVIVLHSIDGYKRILEVKVELSLLLFAFSESLLSVLLLLLLLTAPPPAAGDVVAVPDALDVGTPVWALAVLLAAIVIVAG